jgi:hypothetical protein
VLEGEGEERWKAHCRGGQQAVVLKPDVGVGVVQRPAQSEAECTTPDTMACLWAQAGAAGVESATGLEAGHGRCPSAENRVGRCSRQVDNRESDDRGH